MGTMPVCTHGISYDACCGLCGRVPDSYNYYVVDGVTTAFRTTDDYFREILEKLTNIERLLNILKIRG